MAFKISLTVNTKLDKRFIKNYIAETNIKIQKFLIALGGAGIEVARANCGNFNGLIVFSKMVGNKEVSIVAQDRNSILETWYSGGNEVSAEVSPLLMAEFGSGEKAVDGHRGTFPGQTHAFAPKGWWWVDDVEVDENGVSGIERDDGKFLHHSYGITPTMPMFKAYVKIVSDVDKIAKEVFG